VSFEGVTQEFLASMVIDVGVTSPW
jgi:hypothetical protein